MLIRSLLAILIFVTVQFEAAALAPPSEETMAVYSNAAVIVAARIPLMHLQKGSVDDEMSEKALEIFLNSFDFDHSFFLNSDIERFRQQRQEHIPARLRLFFRHQ